jgi:hypothetical protein
VPLIAASAITKEFPKALVLTLTDLETYQEICESFRKFFSESTAVWNLWPTGFKLQSNNSFQLDQENPLSFHRSGKKQFNFF